MIEIEIYNDYGDYIYFNNEKSGSVIGKIDFGFQFNIFVSPIDLGSQTFECETEQFFDVNKYKGKIYVDGKMIFYGKVKSIIYKEKLEKITFSNIYDDVNLNSKWRKYTPTFTMDKKITNDVPIVFGTDVIIEAPKIGEIGADKYYGGVLEENFVQWIKIIESTGAIIYDTSYSLDGDIAYVKWQSGKVYVQLSSSIVKIVEMLKQILVIKGYENDMIDFYTEIIEGDIKAALVPKNFNDVFKNLFYNINGGIKINNDNKLYIDNWFNGSYQKIDENRILSFSEKKIESNFGKNFIIKYAYDVMEDEFKIYGDVNKENTEELILKYIFSDNDIETIFIFLERFKKFFKQKAFLECMDDFYLGDILSVYGESYYIVKKRWTDNVKKYELWLVEDISVIADFAILCSSQDEGDGYSPQPNDYSDATSQQKNMSFCWLADENGFIYDGVNYDKGKRRF